MTTTMISRALIAGSILIAIITAAVWGTPSTLAPVPTPTPSPTTHYHHGPYTSKDARAYAEGMAKSEAAQRASIERDVFDIPKDSGQTLLSWQHQVFLRTTGCSPLSGAAYVGKGGFKQNQRDMGKFLRQMRRNLLPGEGVGVASEKLDHREKADYGHGPATKVFVVVKVHCPTEEIPA